MRAVHCSRFSSFDFTRKSKKEKQRQKNVQENRIKIKLKALNATTEPKQQNAGVTRSPRGNRVRSSHLTQPDASWETSTLREQTGSGVLHSYESYRQPLQNTRTLGEGSRAAESGEPKQLILTRDAASQENTSVLESPCRVTCFPEKRRTRT